MRLLYNFILLRKADKSRELTEKETELNLARDTLAENQSKIDSLLANENAGTIPDLDELRQWTRRGIRADFKDRIHDPIALFSASRLT